MATNSSKRHPVNGRNTSSSNLSSHQSPSSSISAHSVKKPLRKHSGSLEIIEGDASELYTPESRNSENSREPTSQGTQRPWSRSSVGSVPPRPDSSLSRRLATPTKQICLQAVKRKEESSEPFVPDVDFAALNLDKSYNRAWDLSSFHDDDSSRASTPKFNSDSDLYAPQHATQLRLPRLHESEETTMQGCDTASSLREDNNLSNPSPSPQARAQSNNRQKQQEGADNPHKSQPEQGEGDNQSDDDDDDDDDSDEEVRAPNELLMEFVECLMKKDYKNAEKLCKMILLYEPTNPEALKFQPVIEEKLRLDAEAEAEEADGDEDEDDDDDDGDNDDDNDDDDDDNDDDDDSSSDDEDSDDDDDEESIFRAMAEAVAANYYASQDPAQDPDLPQRPDSGINSDPEP